MLQKNDRQKKQRVIFPASKNDHIYLKMQTKEDCGLGACIRELDKIKDIEIDYENLLHELELSSYEKFSKE